MKEYNVYYRTRGNKGAEEFDCIVTASNIKEARNNFNEFDNSNKEWTITRIERL